MNDVPHILIVEDQSSDYELAQREIRKVIPNCLFERVEKQTDFLAALKDFQPDMILSDYNLARLNGMKVLELAQQLPSFIPIIIWTGAMSDEAAVDCMKRGASNYIMKENLKRLGPAVMHALKERETVLKRKQAEEEYQVIFENSPVGIFQSTPQGRFVSVNAAMARIYGYASPQEMIESITNIAEQIYIEPDERSQFTQILQANGSVENFEWKHKRKDGSVFWTSTSARTVHDESGNILYYEGFLQDITDHKLAEAKLAESEARYHGIFDNAQDAIFVESLDGHILEVNQRACEMFGYSREEFLKKKIVDIVPSEEYIVLNLFPGQTIETINVRGNGEHFPVEISGGLYKIGERNLFLVILRDITERKVAEEQLGKQEQRFRALIENGMDNISLLAKDGTLLWENPAVNSTLGYLPDEFVNRNMFELIHPEDMTWTEEMFARVVGETGSQQRGTFRLRHHDGAWRWVEATATNLLDEPSVGAIVINYRDVTERKQVEETLREERNLLRTLIDNLPDLIYAMDRQGRKTLSNIADWKASGGKTMQDVIGKTDLDIYPPELAGPFWQSDQVVLESGQPLINFEEPGLDDEGNPVSILTTKIPLRDQEGNIIGLVGVGRDITQRKQAEIERHAIIEIMEGIANARDLQGFLELVHHAIARVIYAENFFVVLHQPESGLFEEIYSVDQFDAPAPPAKLEKSITSYVFRSGKPLLLTQALFDELVEQGEVELVGTNSASWLGVPLKTSGRMIGVMTVQDYENGNRYSEHDKEFLASIATQVALAMERKQAEDALHKSESLYRQAIEVAGAVPYYETYYDEGRSIKYEFIGEGIRQITGYGPDEFSAALWDSLVEEINLVEGLAGYSLEEGIQRVRRGENPIWKCEHRIRARDGKIHWVFEAAVELRDENGVSHGSIGTYQDITTSKQAEIAEREQRLLAEALRDTSQILSSSLDYGEVLDHILTTVGQVVPHDAATIMLIEEGFACVVRSQGYEKHVSNAQIMGVRLPLADTTNLRKMLETKQPVVVYDTHSYAGWKRMEATDWLRSNVGAPILVYGEVIGFILLDSETPGFFTSIHAERLEAFANQAALAIHNAHLLQQAQNEIAERKRAEEELRQSENRYRTVVENQTEFIVRWKPNGTRTFVNEAYCHYYGITAEHALTTGFTPFIHEEDRQFVEEKISRLLSGTSGVETDIHRVLKADGTIGWNEWTDQAIYDEDGQLIEFQSVGRDITERKQAEQDLLASEERFRQLADNIEEVFWMTDAQTGKEIYISPAGEKIWGHALDYLFRESDAFIKSVAVEDRPYVRSALEREKNGEKVEIEYRIPSPDGSFRWIWDRAFPIFDENGKVKMLAGIAADITERKQAEDALRESEARFGNAFEFAPIGIALVALDGQWVKVNQALCKLLGYTERELMNKTFQEITHPDDLDADLNYVNQMLQGERISYQMEKRYFNKSGDIVWALLSVSLMRDREGKPQYFISQIQDITERRRAEEEIRRRAKETSALLETSLALTNLDLKAILQSIGNSAKALFAADGCRVFLMQPDGETLRCVLALQENASAFSDLRIKVGEGVTGAVAASGKAEIVNEMQNDPRAVQVPGTDNEEESIMFAPLRERDRTLGVLSIRRASAERHFEPSDLELLEAFASMAASAVSNARLFEEAQQRLAEFEALYENGLAVGQLLEPREIGERIIETFARNLSWHHVTIRLLRPETDELEVIAFNLPGLNEDQKIEMEHHFNQMVSKAGQGLSGLVVQTGTPLRTGNVHANPRYVDTQAGIESGLYMPLKIGDRVIGVISVESEAPNAFTEQDERLLATLGSQAAVAFENARLYQAAHQELLERTRAQAALWASETHYRELADSITDILFEMDYDLRYTHWNKASEMFSGLPAEDVIGRSVPEVFGASKEQSEREEIYKSVLTERQAKIFETVAFPRGQKRVLEINAYPSTRGVSVVAKDITERKLSQMLMEKRFELIEYSSHHSTNEVMQRVIDEISELTESHIGFLHLMEDDETTSELETWSTETLRDFCHAEGGEMHYPSDQAGVWADAVRERRSIIHNDYESLPGRKGMPEGHAKVIREMIIPIIRNEKMVAIMGVGNKTQDYSQHDLETMERFADYAWDIIERRQMENALADERNQLAKRVEERTADLSRANSNLARALRVKDEFLANMSHELRTPLNAILGLSESLGEQVAGPLNEKQQKYLNTINESGHHLLSLINDILDLAKIEAGQITLDINKVDVNSVCQASLRMIKQLAQKKNQEVIFEIDSDLGLMWADERRLKQMLVNLLSNAVKFTPEAGRLGLEVHGDQAGNRVLITVWDQGIGISSQDMERLFKPFVQLDSGLAREATGTGLGLALVAQMARLHGGSVNVESQVGEGSHFTIQLPWEPALAADASTRLRNTGKFRAIDPNATNKPTILVIEDTREVVMMLVDYLEVSGFKMVTAQDGADGIQQAKLAHPDLILMDVMMPGMDGFETTRKLRMDSQFKDTPIIALTALAMPNDRQLCLDAGMDEYISKPVNLKALVKLIRSILLEKEETKPR